MHYKSRSAEWFFGMKYNKNLEKRDLSKTMFCKNHDIVKHFSAGKTY